jgi:hypothetical protein
VIRCTRPVERVDSDIKTESEQSYGYHWEETHDEEDHTQEPRAPHRDRPAENRAQDDGPEDGRKAPGAEDGPEG